MIDRAFVNFSSACVENPGKYNTYYVSFDPTNLIFLYSIDFAMAYYKRGKCYMMMHDYKRALYDFSAAILNETRSQSRS